MPDPNAVVIDTSHSPHAQLCPVPVDAVTLADTFWAPRREINRTVTLPSQYRHLEEAGTLDNFRRAAGKLDGPFRGGWPFMDSDVYKWLEAAAWTLATDPGDDALRSLVAEATVLIADAQQPDGYLHTFHSRERAGERWTNLRDRHEMYCAGHFFQAAIAHHRATGETNLLAVATRFADYLCDTFGPSDQGKHPGVDGHEEVEMALVELFRVTSNRRYLEQAQYFIDARGASPSALTKDGASGDFDRRYFQDHVPFRDLAEVTGHAVRMVYLTCGATDLLAETGEPALCAALDAQWANMTERRMYVTGGLGARHEGEAFGGDYELPSDRAYAETCAAIANVMWNHRLLQLSGLGMYADLMELALYNGVLSGLSLDGTEYFYVNPLADDGAHRRQPWYGCACCPPNVARLIASLPGYFYSVAENSVYVHLYASGTADIKLPSGERVVLRQETNYPWEGQVTITVVEAPATSCTLNLRIPGWMDDNGRLSVNDGPEMDIDEHGCYIVVPCRRAWQAGDQIHFVLPMSVRRVAGHPLIADTRGCVALLRGPLVYCIEQTDHSSTDVRDLALKPQTSFQFFHRPDLLGGVSVLEAEAQEIDRSIWEERLYQPAGNTAHAAVRSSLLTAIPYYAWANREAGLMRVWIPVA